MSMSQTKALSDRALLLAVDLDGTFLGGSDKDRRALYDLVDRRRADVALLFVTGRDIPFASSLASEGVPSPDLIIGDVGTSVVVGPDWTPHSAAEAWIDERWPGPERAAEIMKGRGGVKPQDVFGGRRLSYFYDDEAAALEAFPELEAAGYTPLLSAGVFFDVLPPGVNKGQTLLQVMAHEGIRPERVLCAGDTFNDFSLFETGLRGVAVGNSEPRLRDAIRSLDNVYSAKGEGAGGIVEAIERFKLLPDVMIEAQ